MNMEEYNKLSKIIIDACIAVHKELGPGLLESVYQECLLKEPELRGIQAEEEVRIPLTYKKFELSKEFFIDILVEKEIVPELKSIEELKPVHTAQITSYLKLTNKKLGFLVNFNVPVLKEGFKRFVNNFWNIHTLRPGVFTVR